MSRPREDAARALTNEYNAQRVGLFAGCAGAVMISEPAGAFIACEFDKSPVWCEFVYPKAVDRPEFPDQYALTRSPSPDR